MNPPELDNGHGRITDDALDMFSGYPKDHAVRLMADTILELREKLTLAINALGEISTNFCDRHECDCGDTAQETLRKINGESIK